MYKSKKNFAFGGKTYFEGDVVPEKVAKALGAMFAAKAKVEKDISEGND